MAAWPSTLPAGLPHPVRIVTREVRLRTQMDSGRVKMRARFTAPPEDVTHPGMVLTDTQRTDLETFFVTTTSGGVDEWDWTHPATGAAASFRFATRPTYRSLSVGPATGRGWIADFALEIIP